MLRHVCKERGPSGGLATERRDPFVGGPEGPVMRYAILLDGGWVLKRLGRHLGHLPEAADVRSYCEILKRTPELLGGELLRIYYYDGQPVTGRIRHPMGGSLRFESTPQYARYVRLHDELRHSSDFALRMGVVAVRGWRVRERAVPELAASGRSIGRDDLALNMEQ